MVSGQASPTFVSIDEVLLLHALAILEFGGSAGTRDVGLLESAIAQPQMTFEGQMLHSTVVEMAAAYAFHLCQNHPFVDGNKRTALASCLVFLSYNAIEIEADPAALEQLAVDTAAGQKDKAQIAEFLRQHQT